MSKWLKSFVLSNVGMATVLGIAAGCDSCQAGRPHPEKFKSGEAGYILGCVIGREVFGLNNICGELFDKSSHEPAGGNDKQDDNRQPDNDRPDCPEGTNCPSDGDNGASPDGERTDCPSDSGGTCTPATGIDHTVGAPNSSGRMIYTYVTSGNEYVTAQVPFRDRLYTATYTPASNLTRIYVSQPGQGVLGSTKFGKLKYKGRYYVTAMGASKEGLLIAFEHAGIYLHPKGEKLGESTGGNSKIYSGKYSCLTIVPSTKGIIHYEFLIGKTAVFYQGTAKSIGKKR